MAHGYAAQRKSYCDRTAAGEKARELLGQEWFERFAQVAARLLLYVPLDIMDMERAQNLMQAVPCIKRAAREIKEARDLVGPPTGAIPDGVSIEELRTWASAVTEAEKAVQNAVRATPKGLMQMRGGAKPPKRCLVRVAEDIFAPHPQPVAAIGMCYVDGCRLVPAPALVALAVLGVWPEMPTNATAWAYASVACGLSEPITDDANPDLTMTRWKKVVACWQKTIERTSAEKRPSRARNSRRPVV